MIILQDYDDDTDDYIGSADMFATTLAGSCFQKNRIVQSIVQPRD